MVRLRVRVAKCEDSRRLERQAQEMQLLRGRALPAHKLTDSPVPLRKVLVVVPIRVNHDNRYYTLLNVMHPGSKESVDIPHVWLEVPETDVLEEGRTMAMALLSEHNYEAVSEHGFTFSQRPRVYEHGDVTVVVFDVDLLDTDPMYFEVNAEDLRHPLAPYLHPERDWPDGSYLRTLCVRKG